MVYDLAAAEADYAEWTGPPARSILICTFQRSGSTLLGEAMTFAGGMGCPIEYFHAGFPSFARRWEAAGLDAFVAALHRHRTDPSGTLGVKLMWPDIIGIAEQRDPALAAALRLAPDQVPASAYRDARAVLEAILPSPEWVWLRRCDAVRQAISLFRATGTRAWRGAFAADPAKRRVPEYDFDALLHLTTLVHGATTQWRRFFAENGIPPIEVSYEALDEDYAATLARLFAALGREGAVPPEPRMKRQADFHSDAMLRRFAADLRGQAAAVSGGASA